MMLREMATADSSLVIDKSIPCVGVLCAGSWGRRVRALSSRLQVLRQSAESCIPSIITGGWIGLCKL